MNGIQEVSGSIPLISTKKIRYTFVYLIFCVDKLLDLTAHCNAMRGSDNPHFRQDVLLPRSAKRNRPIGAKNARFHGAA